MVNEPLDVGDEKQVKQSKKKFELVRDRELEEIRRILKEEWGRGFLHRILGECHTYRSTSNSDAHTMAVLSGQRDIGLWLLSEIEQADPNGYVKLLQENINRNS